MKRAIIAAIIALFALVFTAGPRPVLGTSCDAYGNCINSFVSYTRSNPDSTLYPGDGFIVYLQLRSAQNTSSNSVSWNYDASALKGELRSTSASFRLEENVTTTKSLSITAFVTFIVNVCSNGKCSSTSSVLETTQNVVAIPLSLQLHLNQLNSTWMDHLLRNPDGTFYPYDQFTERWNASFKFSEVRKDISINVTSSEPSILGKSLLSKTTDPLGRYGVFLYTVANRSSYQNPYQLSLSAKALNWEDVSLSHRAAQQSLMVKPFVLQPTTRLVNVTDRYGNVERNPDGSFYRNDIFCALFNVTFQYHKFRTDISVSETSITSPVLALDNSTSMSSTSQGRFCYTVKLGTAYGAYHTTISYRARSWNNNSMGFRVSSEPFVVVQYSPHLTYFTYQDYNSRSSSTFGRPFVTLVRYNWNNPGLNYTGDLNTKPVTSPIDLHQRAWINNFSFSYDGWEVKTDFISPDVTQDVSFARNSSIALESSCTNSTKHIIFPASVEKYYFASNVTRIEHYVGIGFEYFNVTTRFSSTGFAGGNLQLFNTSYLYEPVFMNGNVTFSVFGASGVPDSSANVRVSVFNPHPLNSLLVQRVIQIFGNDTSVIRAFKSDLYEAYDQTVVLKARYHNAGVWSFLVNQTNIASINDSQMPQLTINVTQGSHQYSYTVPYSTSLFSLSKDQFSSLPFASMNGYYLDSSKRLVMIPLNLSSGPTKYLVMDYDQSRDNGPYFITAEPGNLSKTYPFMAGQDNSVMVNLDGAPATIANAGPVAGSRYSVQLVISGPSGGASKVSVFVDSNRIVNETIPPNTSPMSPAGYFGAYTFTFPADYNGTADVILTNAWTGTGVLGSYDISYHRPLLPSYSQIESIFALIVGALFLFGKVIRNKGTPHEHVTK